MERLRKWFAPAERATYEPIGHPDDDDGLQPVPGSLSNPPFSKLVYAVFFTLGVSMLWAWNMFLAASPYFLHRFESDDWTATHYQPSILTVSTVTNLASVFVLARSQKGASYSKRITLSLLINITIFTLLAFSTFLLKDASVRVYFAFLMAMVFGASLATGINQNGVFAYVSGFGREEYTQAIMSGQGVAGVLPCLAQMLSVLVVPEVKDEANSPQESWKSAFGYFITATVVSGLALVAFMWLLKQQSQHSSSDRAESTPLEGHKNKSVGLWTLFKKLPLTSSSIFLCFVVTMMFPVFTSKIESVRDGPNAPRLFKSAVFIPLAFFFWNTGDLLARMLVLFPRFSLAHRPWALFVLAIARSGFVPLYLLCNIRGRGAIVESDFFYLFIVQGIFGATNGYLSSCCMMGAGSWVSEDEREPAGGFMSLMLVAGLTTGSLLSFFAASV